MSTKNVLERPWVEFVLGIDQVIRGFDRSLPLMSIGERSKLTFTPEYACKIAITSSSIVSLKLHITKFSLFQMVMKVCPLTSLQMLR